MLHLTRSLLVVVSCAVLNAADLDALRRTSELYLAKKPAPPLEAGISFDAALRNQADYVKLLIPRLGPPVGYKIGFVTRAGQERYGINHPTRGILLRDMLLPNRSRVPANYGARPILEPDLVVRVKDEGINDAKTTQEAARHLSHIVAFIELADGLFATNATVDAGIVTSANVGARAGVLGEERRMEASAEFLEAFGRMNLVLKDGQGKELSRVSAEGMMGHPLNPLLWFLEDCRKRGERVRPGDAISLGSPSPAVAPPKPGVYTLVYEGLPGGPLSAIVTIEEANGGSR